MATLRSHGVMATFHYVPLHSAPHAQSLGPQPKLPVTDRVAQSLLRLPLHPRLADDDVLRVVDAVRQAGA
jgi:dTDP-4-amino-4,6-dideoxygalactose transaminase